MQGKTDTELVRIFADSRDEAAFGELVARHRQMVYRTCLRVLGDPHEAQDAAQAAFVVLVNKAPNLRREGSLTGWLYDVSRKVALEALRRRETRARREKEVAMFGKPDPVEPGSTGDPETILGVLDRELSELSRLLRQAVVLRYLEGHTEREAAALAGCPLGTMKWRASEGISQLRNRLVKRGVAVSALALIGLLEAEAGAAVPEALFASALSASPGVAASGALASSPAATSLAQSVMKAMFWAKVKVSAAAACAAAVAVTVPVAVTIAMAGEPHAAKADPAAQVAPQPATPVPAPGVKQATEPANTAVPVKLGPAKVTVKVGGGTVALSVLKDGSDYFVVCPPCSKYYSCEKLDQNKASIKWTFRKGDTGYYACCPFCLNELNKDTAKFAELFDAGFKVPSDKAAARQQ